MTRHPNLSALLLGVLCVLFAGCPSDDYTQLYRTHDRAPDLSAGDIENLKHLGPTLIEAGEKKGVNFGLYSEHATRVEILLFDDPESNRPTRQFPLTRFGDVWNIFIEGVGVGQHYGYIAWGPNWEHHPDWIPGKTDGFVADVDAQGNRYNPNKLLIDPYAKALHRDHDWSRGSLATGPDRAQVTYAAAAKSVVVKSDYAWGEEEAKWRAARASGKHAGHGWNDLILYEVHLKGMTMQATDPRVDHPGTYRGLGEMADYLEDLGITAVELLPVHEKPLDGGYWGYQTLNFFAPELSYAFDKDPRKVVDEFKWMVEELHKRNIEVILDVVYNHTGEGGLWRNKIELDPLPGEWVSGTKLANFDPKEIAGLYSFRGIDNQAYYALGDDRAFYWNNTGVGNQTRPNHRPFRKLIIDSLRYYAEELHVDGFRFDLAPVLGERDLDYYWDQAHVKNTVVQDIIDDPVLRRHNTRIIAEPWSLQAYAIGGFPNGTEMGEVGWYEWNGRFRDWWRELLNCNEWRFNSSSRHGCGDWAKDPGLEDGGALLTGTGFLYAWNGRRPYHAVNFITVHDGFTLYDTFSYWTKRNKCGLLNPICCDQPNSPFCDRDSGESHNRSKNWADPEGDCASGCAQTHTCQDNVCVPADGESGEGLKRQMMRNAFVSLMIAHGTPLILGGDEWMRTQLGNNNAYSTQADNVWNWFQWGEWQAQDPRHRMHDFVRDLIRLRKDHAYAFAPKAYGESAPFAWKSPGNLDPVWDSRQMMIHYYDPSAGPELAILINMEKQQVDFTLPQGRTWVRLLDTQHYFDSAAWFDAPEFPGEKPVRQSWNITLDDPEAIPGATYGVPARTMVILEARAGG